MIDEVGTSDRFSTVNPGPVSIRRYADGNLEYIWHDHLGSPVAGSGPTGSVLWRESYYPFGQKWQATLNRDKPSFTGHVEDSATGLTYMQARYYDPVLGRFLAPDPVGFAEGGVRYFNRYAYTANDPVNAWDPTGMSPEGFARGVASVPNAYRMIAVHLANKGGTFKMRARAARVEAMIIMGSKVALNDPVEFGSIFAKVANDQGLDYFLGRTVAQSAVTGYAVRKLGGKSGAQKLAVILGAGTINFTATQAGSILDGVYKLDGMLSAAGLDIGGLSLDATKNLIAPLAAGSSVKFDQKTGQVSIVTRIEATTGSRMPKEVTTNICKFEGGSCK